MIGLDLLQHLAYFIGLRFLALQPPSQVRDGGVRGGSRHRQLEEDDQPRADPGRVGPSALLLQP